MDPAVASALAAGVGILSRQMKPTQEIDHHFELEQHYA
jgi:hypothetical protein